jgi:hypothetical protein
LAIIEYNTINIKSGQIKKIVMLLRKKTEVQNVSADVKHTGTWVEKFNCNYLRFHHFSWVRGVEMMEQKFD